MAGWATCYVLRVTCHVSRATCYVLRVTCYVFYVIVASAERVAENTLPDGMAMQNEKIVHSKPKESAMLETYFFQKLCEGSFHN